MDDPYFLENFEFTNQQMSLLYGVKKIITDYNKRANCDRNRIMCIMISDTEITIQKKMDY